MLISEIRFSLKLLRLKIIDTNVQNYNTALHVASFNGHTSVSEYLIDTCPAAVNDQEIVRNRDEVLLHDVI